MNFSRRHDEGDMPIILVPDDVPFPGVPTHVQLKMKGAMKTAKLSEKKQLTVALIPVKNSVAEGSEDRELEYEDVMHMGVAAVVIHVMTMPDGTETAFVSATNRIGLDSIIWTKGLAEGHVTSLTEIPADHDDMEYMVTTQQIRSTVNEIGEMDDKANPELIATLLRHQEPSLMVNCIAGQFPFTQAEKLGMLAKDTEAERATRLLQLLSQMKKLLTIRRNVERKTNSDLSRQQREWFINQEIRNLQTELGENDEVNLKESDIQEMTREARKKDWPYTIQMAFEKGLRKLRRIPPQSSDYNVELGWLQTLLRLPWDECTKDQLDIKRARRILDRDHYGMEKVKERILEHLAVLKLRGDMKSPILCLYGPPGVGKTSLGKSIAEATGRAYVRVTLGGLHDEAEIRGHRRTYVGAMPGRIIKGLDKAGVSNPVFVLDEVDKVNNGSFNGDPSSALLEVLDPEQNSAFHDNYLDLDYDLSKVMFIATANDVQSIPAPLLDRMELIELSGYTTEEKIEIAQRHLVKKEKEANGLGDNKELKISKAAMEYLIENYTRESGVRGLEKAIGSLMRKCAVKLASDEKIGKIEKQDVTEMLGKPKYTKEIYQGNELPGVVTGLAWTSVGGVILFIETSISKGKEGKLTLSGNLGDVMKESAGLALSYIRAHAEELGLSEEIFETHNIHIHVPEGAVPKDGPSAGITMATSLASALTGRRVRKNLAMTGEITLRGRVLPVGGIREKILAAKRAGIKEIILCKENEKDILEIPQDYLKGLSFHYVETVSDVLDYALLK
ncbi:MAG: endopeptidase La [Bacteroidaceae bacterium]|nr:endopeptidase La [Bacteroidaceae bacterium]